MVAALLFLVVGVASPVRAADATVTLNFVNADIDAVIKAVAEITGRNFVVDPRVKGTINIVSAKPVPVSLVYPTLLSRCACRASRRSNPTASSRSCRKPMPNSMAAP